MSVYTGTKQVLAVAAELFSRLAADEEVQRRTAKLQAAFRFELEDLQTRFTLTIDRGRLAFSPDGDVPVKAVLRMKADVFHEAMAGTLNLPLALVGRTLCIEGDTRSVLSLTSLGKALNETYRQVWREVQDKEPGRE